MAKLTKCCICGRITEGDGYDAKPYKNGRCCAACYKTTVFNCKQNKLLKQGRLR